MGKILVAYFSASGVTKHAAEEVAEGRRFAISMKSNQKSHIQKQILIG